MIKTIVEDRDVANAIDKHVQTYTALVDLWEAIKWTLARKEQPEGSQIIGTSENSRCYAYAVEGNTLWNTPNVGVIYLVRENEVEIIDIKIWKADIVIEEGE